MTHSISAREGKSDWKAQIEASGLPEAVGKLIAEVVKRTRLWKREKAEVAMELIAHFQDGMESGRLAEELVGTFGEVKTVAKLIRRGKKRNRPLWWRAGRRMAQGVGVFVVVYVGLAGMYSLRHPVVTVDYLAELNRPVVALAAGDCAWPTYRKAWVEGRIEKVNWKEVETEDSEGRSRDLRPGDADWPKVGEFLKKHRVLVEAARVGGMKPAMGLPVGFLDSYSEEDRKALYPGGLPKWAGPENPTDRSMLLAVPLPALNRMRMMANLLSLDMREAADVGDGERILADCRAMLGLARQLRELPILINELVALRIVSTLDEAIAGINFRSPSVLAGHRVELMHALAGRSRFSRLILPANG